MAKIYVDFTGQESHWDGEMGARLLEQDTLRCQDPAIEAGDVEIIFTITQAITFVELFEGLFGSKPAKSVSDVERRLAAAVRGATESLPPLIARGVQAGADQFAQSLHEHIRVEGLRFRLAEDAL